MTDRILATKNEKLLKAIENIFASTQSEEVISLSSEQIEMLSMSNVDIENGRIVPETDLNKLDSEYLANSIIEELKVMQEFSLR